MFQANGIFRKTLDALIDARQRSAQRYIDTYLEHRPNHPRHKSGR